MSSWLELVIAFLIGAVLGWVLRGQQGESVSLPPRPLPTSAPELEAEVRELLRQGLKIQAIKIYREFHRVGLKEAKDAIDAMERFQPPQS